MLSANTLFEEVDNLTAFVHPNTGRSYRYLSDRGVLESAERLTQGLIDTGIRNVVVSETGAAPFAEVCDRIARRHGVEFRWMPMKIPREPMGNIFPLLRFYLRDPERRAILAPAQSKALSTTPFVRQQKISIGQGITREEALSRVCQSMPPDFFSEEPTSPAELLLEIESASPSDFQRAVQIVLQGTWFSQVLDSPFLYFDEYIDSGTTLRNALAFFRCFATRLRMKTASYFINCSYTSGYDKIAFTLFDKDTRFDGYALGPYPFENRVDLIGHFYTITGEAYERTEVASISRRFDFAPPSEADSFLQRLQAFAHEHRLMEQLAPRFTLEDVRRYVTEAHLLRHCLWWLERRVGEENCAEFLFQIYDMYGPAWSPMPTSYHFDFWRGFEAIGPVFEAAPDFERIERAYLYHRSSILKAAADLCVSRRREWLNRVNTLVEEMYGPSQVHTSSGNPGRSISVQ